MVVSQELKYGVCDCEYPCSCVEFRGKKYGSWKEIIDELGAQLDAKPTIDTDGEELITVARRVDGKLVWTDAEGEQVPEVAITDGKVSEGRRHSLKDKMTRVEECVARMMVQLDPTGARPSTEKTPFRVARMFLTELTSGYYVDIEELFEAVFPNEGSEGMVVVKDIPLYSLCEHHWMPMYGKAHVGYMPDGKVLGLSKAARVVEAYARRFQLQERLTRQVMEAMDKHLCPHGTMVVVEAEHLCLAIRGAQKPGTTTVTSAYSGVFEKDSSLVQEFYQALERSK